VDVDRQWLGEEIGKVMDSRAPDDGEFSPFNPIAYPVVAHVDALGALWLNTAGCNVACTLVVDKDCCGFLRIAEVGKDGAETRTMLSIHEKGDIFGFGNGGHDAGYERAHAVDRAADLGWIGVAEVGNATSD